MTVSDFWHQAFLAALCRVPVEQAKSEADLAVSTAIAHWQTTHNGGMEPVWTPQAKLDITDIRRQSSIPNQG